MQLQPLRAEHALELLDFGPVLGEQLLPLLPERLRPRERLQAVVVVWGDGLDVVHDLLDVRVGHWAVMRDMGGSSGLDGGELEEREERLHQEVTAIGRFAESGWLVFQESGGVQGGGENDVIHSCI